MRSHFAAMIICCLCVCLSVNYSIASPRRSSSFADDTVSIENIVKALYESITFSQDQEPNFERIRNLYMPQASFVRIAPGGTTITDREGFISSFKERIGSGVLKSFSEAEISRRTNVYSRMAQVFSTYLKIMNPHDGGHPVRGINSIQLYHDGQRWWISSIAWEDEQSDHLIPDEYLPQKR